MYEVVNCEKLPNFPYLKSIGGFNELPTPHSVIDWNEYWSLHREHYRYQEFRQIQEVAGKPLKYFKNVHLIFGHTHGLGIIQPSTWTLKDSKVVWTEEPILVRLGCEHKWEEKSKEWCTLHKVPHYGKCYHVSQCTKCAMIDAVDSSD
jgi:hypothetical protein